MRRYIPLLVVAALLVVPFLFARTRVGGWASRWVARGEPSRLKNPAYAVLRREIVIFGKELEALPYERLLELREDDHNSPLQSQSRVVDGFHLNFSTDVYDIEKNGDLHVCIDGGCDELKWWLRALPSYGFTKRKDGTVHSASSEQAGFASDAS